MKQADPFLHFQICWCMRNLFIVLCSYDIIIHGNALKNNKHRFNLYNKVLENCKL